MNLIKKIIFIFKRPSLVLVTGKGRSCAAQAVTQALNPYSEKGKIKIFESDLSEPRDVKKFSFLLRRSKLPILVVTHIGDIPADKDFFAGERKETVQIRKLAKILPKRAYLILNFDDETVREIGNESSAQSLTYGFQKRADFRASDINLNLTGTNFKINYDGNIVPFWLKNIFGKEQIYSVLTAICLGVVKNVNMVEISQALKNYESLPGKMRLINGIKNSLILDDSENATLFSMIEGLDILKKIELEGGPARYASQSVAGGRKIAVLGDVLGIGKYTIEAHETIGEKVAKVSDLLFTVGSRAKFIAQGAKNKGMPEQNIFQFYDTEEAKKTLQKEMKKGDLILVDGSKEMKMGEIIEEIKE
jgi:UDP-N-acetylmuramoyl-tripeptide--D-alanyl-D-alanine ligase